MVLVGVSIRQHCWGFRLDDIGREFRLDVIVGSLDWMVLWGFRLDNVGRA